MKTKPLGSEICETSPKIPGLIRRNKNSLDWKQSRTNRNTSEGCVSVTNAQSFQGGTNAIIAHYLAIAFWWRWIRLRPLRCDGSKPVWVSLNRTGHPVLRWFLSPKPLGANIAS
jgi:hypothetical protein